MAKSNYQFQKRQKELAKKRKKEEKRQRRLEKKASKDEITEDDTTPPQTESPADSNVLSPPEKPDIP